MSADEWEARQIMLCYRRPLKYSWRYQDGVQYCVGFSGDPAAATPGPRPSPDIPPSTQVPDPRRRYFLNHNLLQFTEFPLVRCI